jgi:predicted nucleic acid-binding protein
LLAILPPITNLAAIAQLDLLHQLYGVILIPEAIYTELTRSNALQLGIRLLDQAKNILLKKFYK